MSLVGTTVRSIRVLELLGEGGMGQVYLGYDERLKRKVALKTIRSERRLDDVAKARFVREAQILSQVEHPNICRVYDLLERRDEDLIVLELVEGCTLRETWQAGLSKAEKLRLAEQIAQALVAAHSLSLVHRDLKPGNIMITEDGQYSSCRRYDRRMTPVAKRKILATVDEDQAGCLVVEPRRCACTSSTVL